MRWTLEEVGQCRIYDEDLSRAIELFNKMRSLLTQVYELRKRDVPALSGAEALGLVAAAMVMPKDEYVSQLEALVPYIEERECRTIRSRPRLLVSSDRLYARAFLDLIEGLGCVVAMDDLDAGSRYFAHQIASGPDPLYAIAVRYMTKPPDTRMPSYPKQVDRVIGWARDFRIDGILNLPQIHEFNRLMTTPYFKSRMTKAGIPCTILTRDYYRTNAGQFQTQVQSFLEMIES